MTATYSIAADGFSILALPLHLEQALRDALDGDDRDRAYAVESEVEAAITEQLQVNGVSPDGEWLGNWSAAAVVERVLNEHPLVRNFGGGHDVHLLDEDGRVRVTLPPEGEARVVYAPDEVVRTVFVAGHDVPVIRRGQAVAVTGLPDPVLGVLLVVSVQTAQAALRLRPERADLVVVDGLVFDMVDGRKIPRGAKRLSSIVA